MIGAFEPLPPPLFRAFFFLFFSQLSFDFLSPPPQIFPSFRAQFRFFPPFFVAVFLFSPFFPPTPFSVLRFLAFLNPFSEEAREVLRFFSVCFFYFSFSLGSLFLRRIICPSRCFLQNIIYSLVFFWLSDFLYFFRSCTLPGILRL